MYRRSSVGKGISFLLLCLAFLLSDLSAVAKPPAPAQHSQISPLPDGVELAKGTSELDVRVLEDRLVDVHVRLNGKETSRTPVIDPHPSLRAPSMITRNEKDGIYTLSTADISVRIEESEPYHISFFDSEKEQILASADPFSDAATSSVTMKHAAGEILYGIHGSRLEDKDVSLTRDTGGRVAAGAQGDSGAPFVFSVRYGLLVDSDGGEFVNAPDSILFRHSSRPDVEYFVFIGRPLQTIASLTRLTGPPPLPPKWTFGFLNSQWGSTEAEVEKIVARYRSERLPIDGFILDFDWKAWGEDNYGEWRWNSTSGAGNVAPDKFPDGASGVFAQRLKAEGVKLAGILKPRIVTTVAGHPEQPTMAAAYATKHHFWYPGESASDDYFSHRMTRDIDFNNPDARAWFWEHLKPAFHSGMWGWWNDEADVIGTTTFNNLQFMNMGRMIYDGQRAGSNLRVWSLNRNFYLGASRYGYAAWSGDIESGFASMALQAKRMLAALDTGETYWSMDTGGFHGHPSPENYTRWLEFAAFVPIMRVHGGLGEKRQPWVYGPIAEAAARNTLDLRYELLPYIYSYARMNTEGGVGLVRPLFWEFPEDRAAAAQEDEWMFGDALLVAPVLTQGATSRSIYLPSGEWFDFASGRCYSGGQNITVMTDSKTWSDIPLFIREGSILATQPVEQFVGAQPISEITLDIFPGDSSASFVVYNDDGETYSYEKGAYFRQKIRARKTDGATQVKVDGETGSYISPLHTYLLRIHTTASKVNLDGKVMTMQTGTGELAAGGAHWMRKVDRFGPMVELRIAAGAKSPSVIELQ
ncbi:MAG TPA: TIM-barrel domain-containing protein [Terracidiphilus sp.]|nr:TIM-barrel domain-containing protein [Terracidiphilus sp.]